MKHVEPKIRVLALAAEAFGGYGGIAGSTRDLIAALSKVPEIEKIEILPRVQRKKPAQLPKNTRQFDAVKSRPVYALKTIWRALAFNPDIVYCGHAFMAPLAYFIAKLTRARLISHVHGLEVWQPLSKTKKKSLANSDIILCVSNYTAEKVREITRAPLSRHKVIFNTFGDQFKLGDKTEAREKLDLPRNAKIILTVSRLDPNQRHKGHDRIIPLLSGIKADYPDLIYLVAGTGQDRARLEKLARDTGAADIVQFLGFVANEDLPDLYRASDLYVMPSHGEGFGIAFIEAMACGVPALGLDVAGAKDALRHGELGTAVTEADFPRALLKALSTRPISPQKLSERTRSEFGEARFKERLVDAIKEIT